MGNIFGSSLASRARLPDFKLPKMPEMKIPDLNIRDLTSNIRDLNRSLNPSEEEARLDKKRYEIEVILYRQVCDAMTQYEEQQEIRQVSCEVATKRWFRLLGCLLELPFRLLYHTILEIFFSLVFAILALPVYIFGRCCMKKAFFLVKYFTDHIFHHYYNLGMYLWSMKYIFRTLCCHPLEVPWFLQETIELIRPPEPAPPGTINMRSLPNSSLDCCKCITGILGCAKDFVLNCFGLGDVSLMDEYVVVAKRNYFSAVYYRAMFLSLGGCESLQPFLLCGRCCSCSRDHYSSLKEKIIEWKERRENLKGKQTQTFFRETYRAESYDDLRERYINERLLRDEPLEDKMDRRTGGLDDQEKIRPAEGVFVDDRFPEGKGRAGSTQGGGVLSQLEEGNGGGVALPMQPTAPEWEEKDRMPTGKVDSGRPSLPSPPSSSLAALDEAAVAPYSVPSVASDGKAESPSRAGGMVGMVRGAVAQGLRMALQQVEGTGAASTQKQEMGAAIPVAQEVSEGSVVVVQGTGVRARPPSNV